MWGLVQRCQVHPFMYIVLAVFPSPQRVLSIIQIHLFLDLDMEVVLQVHEIPFASYHKLLIVIVVRVHIMTMVYRLI